MAYIQPRNITANIIKKQVIRVEKLVGERNKFRDVAFKKQRLFNERKRFEESERKVETKQDGKEKEVSNKIPVPKLGFLDIIKNFLFKVLFGVFAIKLLPYLPKLKGVLIGTLKFSEFILGFAGSLLNAFATFIDKAYKIVDFGKQQAKMLGGDKGLKQYEKTLDIANKVINSMLIAGMLFSDLVESDARSGAAQEAVDIIKDRVLKRAGQRAAQRTAINTAARFSARAAAGPIFLVGYISSILGEATFQLRKHTSKIEKDAYSGLAEAQKDPNPFMRFLKVGFYNTIAIPGMRFYNFISTGIGTLLDIIGAPFRYATELIDFGIMSLMGDSEGIKQQRENLGKFDARIREQIRQIVNTLSFGTLAKQQGSFGSLFGDQAVKSMGYASGGVVTRGGEYVGAVTRTVGKKVKARRISKIPTAPLQPGIDVGGLMPYSDSEKISKIETFYPNPTDPSNVNSFKYLRNVYGIASRTKFLHPLLEVSIKTIFGDKPSEGDYKSIGVGLDNFLNDILGTIKSPGKDTSISDEVGPVNIADWVATQVRESITSTIESIIEDLKNQLSLKKSGPTGKKKSKQPTTGGGSENPMAQFGGQAQFVIGDSIAHGFAGRSGNGNDSSDTQVGRSSAEVLATLKSKGDSLKGALIDLSTGIANSTGDWNSVEAQLAYLKSIGARVRILGVANDYSKSKEGINEKLSQLASKYGFYFYGGYTGGKDKLHGTDEDYTKLKRKRDAETAPSVSVGTPTGNINDLVSGAKAFMQVGFPIRGAAYLSGNVQQESGWKGQRAPWVLNDGAGTNKGLVSWNRGRITNAEKYLGKPLNSASNAEQIKWIKHEMQTSYKEAYNIFMNQNASDAELQRASYIYLGYGDVGARYSYAKQALRALSTPQAFHGGPVYKTEYVLTHPGEYVVDADSVRLFGINFYDIINQVETASQRKKASENLVSILSQYTEDGFPETDVDYTYSVPQSSSVAVIPPQVISLPASSSYDSGSSSDDPSMDGLYM